MRAGILHGVIASLVAAIGGCYPRAGVQVDETQLRTVKVAPVESTRVVECFELIGELEPAREAILAFEVPGVIERVLVEEGEQVTAGQPLATLVQSDYRIAVAEAKAQRDAAQAALDLLLAGTHEDEIAAAKAEYERARALAAYWASELKRMKALFADNTLTQSELEATLREHDATKQAEVAAHARWRRAVAGPRQQEIDVAKAELRRLQHSLELAQLRLAKSTLTAPFRGSIEGRFLDEGALVNVFPAGGVPVFHLVDLDDLDAIVAAPETALEQVKGATKIHLESAMQPDLEAEGSIVAVGAVADKSTGTYQVRVRVHENVGRLRGGMVVKIRFIQESNRQAIYIPATVIQHAFGRPPFVYVLDEKSQVVLRDVTLGEIDDSRIEVSSGLAPGDMLIVAGQHHVLPGEHVRSVSVARTAVKEGDPAP